MPELRQELGLCGGCDGCVALLVANEMTIHVERRLDAGMPKPRSQSFEVYVLFDPGGSGGMPQRMKVVSRPDDMWRGLLLVITGSSLASLAHAGIEDTLPPEAYIDPIDQQIARTGVGLLGRPGPCQRERVENGIKVIVSERMDHCVKMLPQQRWRGLWRNAFEGSRFCPEPAKTCDHDTPGERIWLNDGPGRTGRELYQVEFLGRRTMYKGPYGHMDVSDHEMTMDRVISMKLLWAPPPPTKAEIESMRKQCEAEPACRSNEEMMRALQQRE